jgi:endonuclease/exonuclease/phosphatase family metal-dependent hydrolase
MGFSLATFNVKDLLEPRLDAKLDCVAGVLARADADVVALQEIGPPDLLDAVLDRLPQRGRYAAPIVGTADARGIRCALLSRLPVLAAQIRTATSLPFPAFRVGDAPPFGDRIPLRRGVVHARLDAPGGSPIHVLVAHFKSSIPVPLRDAEGREVPALTALARSEASVRSLAWRVAEALYVRSLVDEILAAEGDGARAAVAGDLNDGPASLVVRLVRGLAGASVEEPATRGLLFDCAVGVEEARRFSTYHEQRPSQIDHVLATAPLHATLASARFLNEDLLLAKDRTVEVDVASDHAPLIATFG